MSPFLSYGAIESLPVPWDQLTLVSRPDQLDREFDGRTDESATLRALELVTTLDFDSDDPVTLTGLHAKVWVFDEAAARSTAFVGSANATNAAFSINVELLLELSGATKAVGVGRWIDGDDSMTDLVRAHIWGQEAEPADAVQERLDDLRHRVAVGGLSATAMPIEDGRFDVAFVLETDVEIPADVRLDVRPLSLAAWTEITGGGLSASFQLDAVAISAFLAVRLTEGANSCEFLLKADLEGAPDDREAKVLAALLANPERLVHFLLLLLADPLEDRFSGDAQRALDHSRGAHAASLPTVPLLEVMARALARDPGRLAEVDLLMTELRKNTDSVGDLFLLWDSVREAAGMGARA